MPNKIIVLGNEKGGTGKSTVGMHLIANFLADGASVGSIDVDLRQQTLTRYCQHRMKRKQSDMPNLLVSKHIVLTGSQNDSLSHASVEDSDAIDKAVDELKKCDIIVIDTPGSHTAFSKRAHFLADIVITPVNDSLVDIDMIVKLDDLSQNILRPSTFSETVWEQKKQKLLQKKGSLDWCVMRNRIANIHSKNREEIQQILLALSKRMGFKLINGFSERVIFRELFLSGLTLLDIEPKKLSISHVAAKQELRNLVSAIGF